MNPIADRQDLRDAFLEKSIALPATGGTVTTDPIDLVNDPVGRGARDMDLVITTTTATGVDAKTHTITLLESSSPTTGFAASPSQPTFVNTATTTGGPSGAAGFPAKQFRCKLQTGTKRYLKAQVVGNSGSGNSVDGTVTISLRK